MEAPILYRYLHLSLYQHSGHIKVLPVPVGKELLKKYNIPKKFRMDCLYEMQVFGLIQLKDETIHFKKTPRDKLKDKEIITYINNSRRPRKEIYDF